MKVPRNKQENFQEERKTGMYYILFDTATGTYYMEPEDLQFHVYTDSGLLQVHKPGVVLRSIAQETEEELQTRLYNAGFYKGYLDNKQFHLSKSKLLFYERNPNEILYAQYLLTKNPSYLEMIKKSRLITLCKLDHGSVLFPTTQTEDEETHETEKLVLAYTDGMRMPGRLLNKYSRDDGWRKVQMTFDARCIVNESFIVQ